MLENRLAWQQLLEEEPHAGLHNALAELAVDASEHVRVRIVDDVLKYRMVEDVERLDARLEVARPVVAKIELLEEAGVGVEAARIA